MDNFSINGVQDDHGSLAQDHAWHRGLLPGYAEESSYTMPSPSYTNGGLPSWSGPRSQFVSDPQLFVPYPGPWSSNGGYQYRVSVGPSTEHNSHFAMPPLAMILQTQTVPHAAANVHPSFAPATLTPTAEPNSLPILQGIFGATGQGIALDTNILSIRPNPTAMPLLAPVSGTPTPTSSLSDLESTPNIIPPPVVRCMVDNCDQDIAVDKIVLRQHLTTSHHYPTPHRSRSVLCRWSGCLCTRPSTCRSPNLGVGHGVHIEDITDHVWSAHLSFQDVCGKCGDARWARGFSFQRHVRGCAGGKPARCVGCCQIFRSTIALAVHVELGQCVGHRSS
jgi:hypothetical protein